MAEDEETDITTLEVDESRIGEDLETDAEILRLAEKVVGEHEDVQPETNADKLRFIRNALAGMRQGINDHISGTGLQ